MYFKGQGLQRMDFLVCQQEVGSEEASPVGQEQCGFDKGAFPEQRGQAASTMNRSDFSWSEGCLAPGTL